MNRPVSSGLILLAGAALGAIAVTLFSPGHSGSPVSLFSESNVARSPPGEQITASPSTSRMQAPSAGPTGGAGVA